MYKSDRDFKLWDYRVSHGQLLLRSPMSPDHHTNVDIQFFGVELICLPTFMHGIRLRLSNGDERDSDARRHAHEYVGKVFSCNDNGDALVIAAGCRVLENTMDIIESSLFSIHYSEDRPLGTVLARSEK